ncbi:hypothetical protein JRO89_XS01G0076400 [Xanthoceras sorbifolium]|uniref:Uncharacterized protein n=1 Tax=Xanthoceras sorbifolium TaxID=99658 RepID=A0ABQ8IJ03_9ROSI|nr:hypothetical protein JRO89_XS01G0076400 [Xanthoceras sorbifolium]
MRWKNMTVSLQDGFAPYKPMSLVAIRDQKGQPHDNDSCSRVCSNDQRASLSLIYLGLHHQDTPQLKALKNLEAHLSEEEDG